MAPSNTREKEIVLGVNIYKPRELSVILSITPYPVLNVAFHDFIDEGGGFKDRSFAQLVVIPIPT